MAHSSLAKADLNLLVTLDALLGEKSVTRAASRLGVTQSAMSHALNRLRAQFDDPLLVRRGGTMVPTPLAERLVEPLAGTLGELERLFASRSQFDPATDARRFSILASDYAAIVILPGLMRRLRRVAPAVDLLVRSRRRPERSLAEEDFDLMIGPVRAELPSLYRQRLLVDRLVCVARRGHPALAGGLTLERYLEAQHVLVSPRGLRGGFVDDELARRGLERRVALEVPHFVVAPMVIADSDMLLTIPERLADRVGRFVALDVAPVPLDVPDIEFAQLWHERNKDDAANIWLRGLVLEVARDEGQRAS
jgi:DNA-binding transcriptional LysR family regulator